MDTGRQDFGCHGAWSKFGQRNVPYQALRARNPFWAEALICDNRASSNGAWASLDACHAAIHMTFLQTRILFLVVSTRTHLNGSNCFWDCQPCIRQEAMRKLQEIQERLACSLHHESLQHSCNAPYTVLRLSCTMCAP